MPGLIPASTVCDAAAHESSILDTCDRMIRGQVPNLLRLYINPSVAQACYCLTHLIAEAWPGLVEADEYQVFLGNSEEESLSGAIKLARFAANTERAPGTGVILDEDGRFEHFSSTDLVGHGRLEFIPGVEVTGDARAVADRLLGRKAPVGFVVISHESLSSPGSPLASCNVNRATPFPLFIVCTNQREIIARHHAPCRAPDIVVFNESFVNRDVPFGAFAATKRLFRYWNRRGMTTFHSTTYQPNTISTMHLVSCLGNAAPEFMGRHRDSIVRIENDAQFRYRTFRDLYSRSLAKLTSAAGLEDGAIRASGHYVSASGKRIFDGVAGVACSLRGHNPRTFVAEIQETGELQAVDDELADRLASLTDLPRMVPAVSGASAVEHALKLGLATQFPRDWVLALRGGFAGKTLFALTGTWKPTLKAGLAPLYPNVVYIDPFAADAAEAIDRAFRDHPIGVVQLELIQGVGGVRAVPTPVIQQLAEMRRTTGCLLLVDEVQTGMFRTGPFVRSSELRIQPDLLAIGKGTSDMMFPFAMTLYSDAVARRLDARGCLLPQAISERYGYETGLRAVLSTLRRAEAANIAARVRERSELFARLLTAALRDCRLVRDVRCFGLLIGIELDAERRPHRWLKKLVCQLYLLALLSHDTFPLLVGYCQYEPNVLKLTPPLSVTEDEVHSICATISSVLHRPLSHVALSGLIRPLLLPRPKSQRSRFGEEAQP